MYRLLATHYLLMTTDCLLGAPRAKPPCGACAPSASTASPPHSSASPCARRAEEQLYLPRPRHPSRPNRSSEPERLRRRRRFPLLLRARVSRTNRRCRPCRPWRPRRTRELRIRSSRLSISPSDSGGGGCFPRRWAQQRARRCRGTWFLARASPRRGEAMQTKGHVSCGAEYSRIPCVR